MSKSSFHEKLASLEASLEESRKKVSAADGCFPTLIAVGIAIPFLLLIILFFLQPSFVQRKEGNKFVRDGRKIFFWTVVMTAVAWLALYLYSWCTGYNASMICAR